MTISRAIFEQEEKRIELIADKIRHDVFSFDLENLYSVDDIAKKLPRFPKIEIEKAIQFLKNKGSIMVCYRYGGTEYYGHRYV